MTCTSCRGASQLKFRMTLEEPAETLSIIHGNPNWPVRATVWAAIEAVGGTRGDLVADAVYRITIRYREDIKPTWRLGLGGTNRKFKILKPPQDPDGDRRWLEIVVQETL